MKYRVVKDIPNGWEGKAVVGDILYIDRWMGEDTLFLNGDPICDLDSRYAEENCVIIEDGNET